MTPAQGLELVRWIRGQDSLDADGDGNLQESRPGCSAHRCTPGRWRSVMAPVRGLPASVSNPDIRLFFGTNDGVFHSLRNTAESGDESGRKAGLSYRLRCWPCSRPWPTTAVLRRGPQPYGIDGEAVAQIEDRDGDGIIEEDGDIVRVFIGQRRGGRAIYAFDMSDPDHPAICGQSTT